MSSSSNSDSLDASMDAAMGELVAQLDMDDVEEVLAEETQAKALPKPKTRREEKEEEEYECQGLDALDLFIKRRKAGVYLEKLLDRK